MERDEEGQEKKGKMRERMESVKRGREDGDGFDRGLAAAEVIKALNITYSEEIERKSPFSISWLSSLPTLFY